MKIERIVSMVVLGGILAGCATKEMKSTPFYEGGEVAYVGDAADRVNLWPVAYWRNPVGAVAWPLVSFSDDHFALRPIYSQYKQAGRDGAWNEFNFVWPIVQADTKHDDYRIFPIFWGEDYQAVFPIYWNGAHYNSLFPIWYYGSTMNSWHFNTLAGLAGACRKESGYRASWTFPLWFEDNTGLFTTLLYGQTRDSHWVFPLWYKGEKAFISPFYAQGGNGSDSWWAVPLLLSWGKTKDSRCYSENALLFCLVGWETWKTSSTDRGVMAPKDKQGLKALYVSPLFSWNDNGSWLTPLCGQENGTSVTNTYIAPLVGVTTGEQTGGWVYPFWTHKKDVDFDAKKSLIDSPTLPDCVTVSVVTNTYKKGAEYGKTRLHGKMFCGRDSTCILLHDIVHNVDGSDHCPTFGSLTNLYEISEYSKRGHNLLFNYRFERSATFDLKTKAKLSDKEENGASMLVWLYDYKWSHDRSSGDEYSRHRVLWRLWNWEEKNGEVSLDVFPGFTYDARKDGYTKTSLLWRLFRYERDPNAGTSVDFLFVPVWR